MTVPLERWTRRFDAGELVLGDASGVERARLTPDRAEIRALELRLRDATDPLLSGWVGTRDGVVAKLIPGVVHASVPPGARLAVSARALGGPSAHVLVEPLYVECSGAGLRLTGLGPALALRAATLHPDGTVTLASAGTVGARRLALVARVLSAIAVRRPKLARHLRIGAAAAALGCAPHVDPGTCDHRGTALTCGHDTVRVSGREVHVAVPPTEAPEDGWPVAWLFQGSFAPAGLWFSASSLDPAGAIHGAETTERLLDQGFAVLAPEAAGGGHGFWDTNVPPWSTDWEASPDAAFLLAVEDAVDHGELGPLATGPWMAAGISSGGYQTSRMAGWQPDRFAAVAIVAASYATCAGAVCSIPDALPPDHPPTLFLHGSLDPVVPIATMWPYHDRLGEAGVEVRAEVRPLGVHAFPPDTADAVGGWFAEHR